MTNTIDNLKKLPKELYNNLRAMQGLRYKELYENTDSIQSLNSIYRVVLAQLEDNQVCYMCSILAKAVLPTLKGKTIDLKEFTRLMSYGNQATDEALQVLVIHQKMQMDTLSLSHCRAYAIEMLELIIEGYAIFPGMAARRELFDWWLTDVVPAAYNLSEPDKYPRQTDD